MHLTVPLNADYEALISPEDAELILCDRWFVTEVGPGRRYAVRQERENGRAKTVYLHRRIMGAQSGQFIDHINRDGLDNRRENLRFATRSQNNANCRARCPHGFRGIYPERKRWVASISVNNKNVRLGRFADRESAARAYDAAAVKHYGEFAVLNFPAEA